MADSETTESDPPSDAAESAAPQPNKGKSEGKRAKKDKAGSKKDKGAKDKGGKKDKGGGKKDKASGGEAAPYASIATHPRASASVHRVKAWTGLIAFLVAGALSLKAGVPFVQMGLRAVIAGIAGYMLAWWAGVQVWRHLMIAEQRAAAEEISRRRAEHNSPETPVGQ